MVTRTAPGASDPDCVFAMHSSIEHARVLRNHLNSAGADDPASSNQRMLELTC
jgi:hypothetical protein